MMSSFSSGLRVRPPGLAASFSYAVPTPPPPARDDSGVMKAPAGAWGDLEYHYIYLEASEHVVSHFKMPAATPKWTFVGKSLDEIAALFEAARVPEDWIRMWMRQPCLMEGAGVVHILPPMEHLEALMPEQRALIFSELAKHPENEFHRDPVFITSGSVEEFLRHTGISQENATWFGRMCYRRGRVLCFSDLPALLARARNSSEAMRFMKLCTRTRGIVARLRVTDQTDFQAVMNYWSDGERRKDVLPILLSLADLRNSIDLIHLLPPLARKLLNGYPPFELAIKGRMPDCHWSSLNFFNYEPRDYFLDTRLAATHVMEHFTQIAAPYRYGDRLLFLNAAQHCFHSCVYIGADIVFTKNGDNAANPWILSHLTDLEQIYLSNGGGYIQGYRSKH